MTSDLVITLIDMASDTMAEILSKIRGDFVDGKWQTKKRHPRKDVSVSGVEQGGTVEKPWPPVAS